MDDELDIDALLGAEGIPSVQRIELYIATKRGDNEKPIENHEYWVTLARTILAKIGGGSTAIRDTLGAWFDERKNDLVREDTTLVYTYMKAEKFIEYVGELRDFLHRFGRENAQGEVMVAFVDGAHVCRITKYDDPK